MELDRELSAWGGQLLLLLKWLEPISTSHWAHWAWPHLPNCALWITFGISGVCNKTKSPATKKTTTHTVALNLQWKAHSTGNKAAGFRPRLFTFLRYCLSQLPGGKPHCERTLNYGCSFSWRLNFWQEVWTAVLLVVQPVTDGFFSTAPLLPWEGHNPYEDWWTCFWQNMVSYYTARFQGLHKVITGCYRHMILTLQISVQVTYLINY